MVHGATDAEARRKADAVDAELRNRKAARERVVSIAVDRPAPLMLSEFLVVWHEAHGKEHGREHADQLRGRVRQVDRSPARAQAAR
jgi:hypothetical protein